jgi:hypothetical protein
LRHEKPWPLASTLLLLGASWLTLSWPWLTGAVTIPWDAKAHFYPQLQFLAQAIHAGEAPFWTPYVFSGTPQIADPQSLIFSPPYLLLALLDPDPGFRAFDAVALAMLGLGGVAVFGFFRDRGWHPAGGLVAAIVFAFGASAAWRIQHIGQILSLSYLPIVLSLLARALERRSMLYGMAAGTVAAFLALGRDQVAFLSLLLLAGFVLWHWTAGPNRRDRLRTSLLPLAAAAGTGALLVAIPVLLTALLAQSSNRVVIDYAGAARGSLHPALLLTGAVPNLFGADGPFGDYWGPPSPRWGPVDLYLARNMGVLYVGALPLALVVLGTIRGVLRRPPIRFFAVALAAMLVYALGGYTPAYRLLFLIPGADLFRRPADATFLIGALAAMVAGYAAHRLWTGAWPKASRRGRFVEPVVLAAPFAAGAAVAAWKGTLGLAALPLAKAALCLAVSVAVIALLPRLRERSPPLALLALVGWVLLDLGWNNGPNESTALPPATYDVLRPDTTDPTIAALKARLVETASDTTRNRIELTGLGFHWPNATLVQRLDNVLGYNPVRLADYTAATGAGDHVALPEQRTFAPLFPSYRSTLADLLGLRLIATGVPVEQIDPKLKDGDLTLVARTATGFVYENPRARPRVFFAPRAQAADFAAMLRDGKWPDIDLSTTVLLDAPGGAAAPPADAAPGPATVRLAHYGLTDVVVDVDAPSAGHVVLNDPYQPWWFAEVDGREVPVLRANVLFRAVAISPGMHRVRFVFRPLAGAWRELRGGALGSKRR